MGALVHAASDGHDRTDTIRESLGALRRCLPTLVQLVEHKVNRNPSSAEQLIDLMRRQFETGFIFVRRC
jgi:hypothetical protein